MVLNWRRRYAIAPTWIALAISTIFGVPVSEASTPRMRNSPTSSASTAVRAEKINQNHSADSSVKDW